MKLKTDAAKRLREKCVEKYAEIATLGASAPVSANQLIDAATVIDKPLSDNDSRTVMTVAKQRKTRADIKEFARKSKPASQITPDALAVIRKLTESYKKPWSRKSAVMLEVLLENTKLIVADETPEPKPAAKKTTPRKRATKTAAKKTAAKK